MSRVGLITGAMLVLVGCFSSSSVSTIFHIEEGLGTLQCPTEMWESTEAMLDAEAQGSASFEEALDEFFDGPGQRFSDLMLINDLTDDMDFAYADEDGLVRLIVRVTPIPEGLVVAGWTICADYDY